MVQKLDAYRGRLSPRQIAEGMNAATRNARRLTADAQLLFDAGSFPTAASVAALAIEESGKVTILRSLSLATSDEEAIKSWREYRSHTKKNAAWIMPQLFSGGARQLEQFRTMYDSTSDHPHVLDQLKQLGFYTDCLGKARWSVPEEIVERDLAESLVATARILSAGSEHTDREIELWIEHVGPVWGKDMAWMQQALVNWYAAMQDSGLAPPGENRMQAFAQGRPIPGGG